MRNGRNILPTYKFEILAIIGYVLLFDGLGATVAALISHPWIITYAVEANL